MQGLLLVDKPSGWTSFDVVNYVRKIVATAEGKKPKNTKVGHTGTLDPLATGLLILLVGKEYTRRAGELTKQDKTYEVVMKLGETSATGDEEGNKTAVSTMVPSLEAVQQALNTLQGALQQIPPAYSAVKVNGQRAYKLAREGKAVELEARPVIVYSNELTSYEYPFVHFTSRVSSGTYIRTLVEDIGSELGTGAYMAGLRRTAIADYQLSEGLAVSSLDAQVVQSNLLIL